MYASVEMLLKFCAEKFSFNCTGPRIREKCGPARTSQFCKEEKSRWRSRHFTQPLPAIRIHFALVQFHQQFFQFLRGGFRAGRNVR